MIDIKIGKINISNSNPLTLILGPCVIESREHTLKMAKLIHDICAEIEIEYVFKASFDKANRSSIESNRGISLDNALDIFLEVKSNFECPILTDVHNENQCEKIAQSNAVDIIQIPAFLSRQTDLLIAAGNTNKVVNVKKGQFLSPNDMPNIIKKIESTHNTKILLTERGVSLVIIILLVTLDH